MQPEVITATGTRNVEILDSHPQLTVTRSRMANGERVTEAHVHREHVDAFYVLDGAVTFEVGPEESRVVVHAGGFVAIPAGVAHGFLVDAGAAASYLNFHAPDAGFADFLRGMRDGKTVAWDSHEVPHDGGASPDAAVVLAPGEGEALVEGNRTAVLKSDLPELFVAEFVVDGPRGGPDPHSHDVEIDSFYPLEGELEVTVGDETRLRGPGDFAAVPVGVMHTFTHPGDEVARFLNVHAPDCGFANFMRHGSRA
jgi:quercetin dioxygenase-like cupin family protein